MLMAAFFAGDADAQLRAIPVSEPGVVYEMEGYSVLSPRGKNWFELKRDGHSVYFGKKIASRSHAFIATATSGLIAEKFEKPEEFRDYIGRMLPVRGDERHTVIENRAELDQAAGRFCVRHYTKTEDRGAVYARGKTLLAETVGVSCLHPDNPGLSISISYTERGYPQEVNAALRAEGESFVRSLRFIPR